MQTTFEYFLVHQTQRPLSAAARELVTRLEEALRHTAEAWAERPQEDTRWPRNELMVSACQ